MSGEHAFLFSNGWSAWRDDVRIVDAQTCHERYLVGLSCKGRGFCPSCGGVDFVGYIVRPTYLLPRRRVVEALREKLAIAQTECKPVGVPEGVRLRLPRLRGVRRPVRAWRVDEGALERLRETWASYEGHFVHGSSFRLRERLWDTHPGASRLLARERGRVVRRFSVSRPVVSLRAHVERLALGIGPHRGSVLLVQVGRFVEVFRNAWRLGLRQRKVGRRWTAGAPWVAAARVIERGLSCGLTVGVALEEPEACGNVKRRRLAYIFERPSDAEAEQEESK